MYTPEDETLLLVAVSQKIDSYFTPTSSCPQCAADQRNPNTATSGCVEHRDTLKRLRALRESLQVAVHGAKASA